MTDAQEIILVCVPTASMLFPVAGARMGQCRDCEQRVWLAPSSWPQMDRVIVVCMACAIDRVRKANASGEPHTFAGTLPGQLDELMAAGLPEMTAHHLDQIDAAMLEKLAEKDNAD